jgi:LmbE family N-acetylglucosaminyl deacetylase
LSSYLLDNTLAKCAAEGVDTHLVTATRGERGRFGSQGKTAEPAEVGRVREVELRAAATMLGIRNVSILGYADGAVDQMDAATAIRAVAWHIRRIRPHVVVTFGPEGGYGHPDHIAISQFTTAATVCASDS